MRLRPKCLFAAFAAATIGVVASEGKAASFDCAQTRQSYDLQFRNDLIDILFQHACLTRAVGSPSQIFFLSQPDIVPAAESGDGELIAVELGGNKLAIPERYFPLGAAGSSPSPRALSLMAHVDTMAPMRDDNKSDFLYDRHYQNTLYLLIEPTNVAPDLEFSMNTTLKSSEPYERVPDANGLEAYIPANPVTTNGPTGRQEVYARHIDHVLTTFIRCTLTGTVPAPGCEQEFEYDGFWIKLGYGKQHLPDWHTLQTRAERLIDKFQTDAQKLN